MLLGLGLVIVTARLDFAYLTCKSNMCTLPIAFFMNAYQGKVEGLQRFLTLTWSMKLAPKHGPRRFSAKFVISVISVIDRLG